MGDAVLQEAAITNRTSAFNEANALYQEALEDMSQAHEVLVRCQAHAHQLGKHRQRIEDECSELHAMYTSLLGEPLLEECPQSAVGNKARDRARLLA